MDQRADTTKHPSGASGEGGGAALGEIAEEVWREWMRAAQVGDRDAYETLLRALLPQLRRFTRRRIGDAEAAEDVVQDVLLLIHRARHTYRPERAFAPWWRTIARNAAIDYYRKRGRRVGRELPIDDFEIADEREPDAPQFLAPELQEALETLPVAQRQAVELIHLKGMSVSEAAEEAGVKPGALKVRAHRGYKALRKHLEEVGW